jgi:hypothetical protein
LEEKYENSSLFFSSNMARVENGAEEELVPLPVLFSEHWEPLISKVFSKLSFLSSV